jgi:peptide chain release factor 2
MNYVKRCLNFGGTFDIDVKTKRIDELKRASENPKVWNDHKEMQKINKELTSLGTLVSQWEGLSGSIDDAEVLLEMAVEETDEDTFTQVSVDIQGMQKSVDQLETQSLLNGELDHCSAYLSIHSGAGGTEACDWAQMLMRMFIRYSEDKGYKTQILSISEGDETGIKSATLLIEGEFSYGYLKSESGVHRLVRISPFDSNARRHTSFSSVFCWPEVDDNIEIEINSDDLRIDTYRSSGKGGQHVNKTDSAVRITHAPSGVVVQCQSQRSQIANKDKCMKMLKSALYELEIEKQNKEKDDMNATKKANEWGSQIRSYVLAPYQMVKDHRTNHETSLPNKVLDGDLGSFVESFLKMKAMNK